MRVFRLWALSYLILLLAAAGVAVWEPKAFQKANISYPAAHGIPNLATGTLLDVDKVIGGIPYRGGEVWAVEPSRKFEATIVEGRGNCATKTLGLAYYLGQSAIDFQIIDLIHPTTFLDGSGHTLLRVTYHHDGEKGVGLVDLLEGGLPYDGERYLDVADLVNGAIPNVRVDPLNKRKDDHARYFGEFLDGVIVAFRPAVEVNRYHSLLASIYVPLGNEKFEKYLYDGLLLLLGFLPSLHITDYDRLLESIGPEVYLHRFALWVLRSAFIALPFLSLIGWRLHRSKPQDLAGPRSLHRQLDPAAR